MDWFVTTIIVVVMAVIVYGWVVGPDWMEDWWVWTLIPIPLAIAYFVWQAWGVWQSVPSINTVGTVGNDGSGGFLTILIIAVVCIIVYRWTIAEPPIWMTVTAICIPLFLWGCWLIQPEWYLEWRHSEYFLWSILAVVTLGWLADYEGTIALIARSGLILLLIIAAGIGAYGKWSGIQNQPRTDQATSSSISLSRLPAEVVLPLIAKCESGGEQFDDNGDVIENATTSAVGKYQILEKLHGGEAQKLGLNLRSSEGNEAFARVLYAREGLEPWEASRWCWEKDLLALGYLQPTNLPTITRKVVVGREWTEPIRFPVGRRVDWMPESAVTYELMTADGKTVTFPAITQAPIEVRSVLHPWIKFRAIDADSVVINVVAKVPR